MNEHREPTPRIDPVEQWLAEQPLRQPSDRLDRRIDAVLAAARRRPVLARIGPWLTVAGSVAALIALALLIRYNPPGNGTTASPQPGPVAAAENDAPMEIEQRWDSLEPGRIMLTEDHLAVQPVRYRSVRQTRWVDPQDNVEYELTVPQERVLLMPIHVD